MLNCIISEKHQIKEVLFESGISIGGGMTSQLQEKNLDEIIYLDTPGLEDKRLRKQAAEAITNGLRKNGMYKVFFVTTLESGRVRASDAATIRIVMDCAKEIKHYGIIINKLSRNAYEKLKTDKAAQDNIIAQLKVMDQETGRVTLPVPLFLPLINKLDDEDNALADVPDLLEFMDNVGENLVRAKNVETIPDDNTFEKHCKQLEKLILDLRYDNKRLQDTIAENSNHYQVEEQRLLQEMRAVHSREIEQEKIRCENRRQDTRSKNNKDNGDDYVIVTSSRRLVENKEIIDEVVEIVCSPVLSEHQKLQSIRKLWNRMMKAIREGKIHFN